MEMNTKERILSALKGRNFFETYNNKDSFQKLENAHHLEDVIFQIERGCNVDQLFFRYNPITEKLHRVAFNIRDRELLHKEEFHLKPNHPNCAKRHCYDTEISIDDFTSLLAREFEAIAIFEVGEKH